MIVGAWVDQAGSARPAALEKVVADVAKKNAQRIIERTQDRICYIFASLMIVLEQFSSTRMVLLHAKHVMSIF